MQPSRGDRKPCSVDGCSGMMQFGRRLQSASSPGAEAPKRPAEALDARGWVCTNEPGHFCEVTIGSR